MLTYFRSVGSRKSDSVFPVTELINVSVFLGHRKGAEKKRMAVVSALPAVFDKETCRTYIGGRKFALGTGKTRYVPAETPKARPLGWLRDFDAEEGSLAFKATNTEAEIKSAAENMLCWAEESAPPYGDKELFAPDLVVRLTPRTTVRDGKTLRTEARRANALKKWWPDIPEMSKFLRMYGLVAPERGVAQQVEDGVKFTSTETGKTESFSNAEVRSTLEKLVSVTFGAVVSIPVWPAVQAPQNVAEGATLFAPVPPNVDPWKLPQHSSWEAVKYCAALSACREWAGATLIPAQIVNTEKEPWVDLRNHPRFLKLHGADAARYEDEALSVDLLDTPMSGLRARYMRS